MTSDTITVTSNLVTRLKNAPGYLSGEAISRQLKISRAAVWKHMQELRRLGYVLEAAPHRGYRLKEVPDCLYPWEVTAALPTACLGQRFEYHPVLSSTQDEIFRLGREGAPAGTVVYAEHQTEGRGRLGRRWVSSKGTGLTFSVLFRPRFATQDASRMTLMAAVALCRGLQSTVACDPKIKWPNDIYCQGRKLAGILTEMHAEIDRIQFVAVGIGINVSIRADELPEGATSLMEVTGQSVSRVKLLRNVLLCLEEGLGRLEKNEFEKVLADWRAFSQTIGRQVTLVDRDKQVSGTAVDLSPRGGLLVRTEQGDVVEKFSGDVVVHDETGKLPC